MYRYFLALRYLLSRPINLLGMAGVSVSVWALIVVVSIFSGFLVRVRKHVQAATSDLTVLSLPWPNDYQRIAEVIRRDPNVAHCSPRLVWYGLLNATRPTRGPTPQVRALDAPGADSPFVSLIGVDPVGEAKVTGLDDWLRAADDPALHLDDPATAFAPRNGVPAMVPSERRLRALLLRKGDTVRLTSARLATTPNGQALRFLEEKLVVAGAYRTKHTAFDAANCLVHIDALRQLMGPMARDAATEVVVRCHDPSLNAETAARLERTLNDRLQPRGMIHVRTWEQMNGQLLSAVEHQRSLMKLVLFVIMVVAAFLLFATLSMMATEKTHDIGILTAMGATPRGVAQVFLSCGLAIVLIGSALGIVAGCLSSIYLDAFNGWLRATFAIDLFPTRIYNLDHVPYDLDVHWIAMVAAMALGVGLVVSGLPAWRAARHDPLQCLRTE